MAQQDLERPARECRFCAFDVETTGLMPGADRLLEVGALLFTPGSDGAETFESLVDPGEPIPPEATRIHGITNELVAGAPPPREVVARWAELVADPDIVLVAHNAPFDLRFIGLELLLSGQPLPPNPTLDTLRLARALLKDLDSYRLETVAAELGGPPAQPHRALGDARILRTVVEGLLEVAPPDLTLGQLLKKGRSPRFAGVLPGPDALPKRLAPVAAALQQQRPVSVVYEGGSRPGQPRTITPLAVFRLRTRSYVFASAGNGSRGCVYRVDRLKRAEVGQE